MKKVPTTDVLHKYFVYSKGKLFWRKVNSNRAVVGNEAGSINSAGYRIVRLHGKDFLVHRIIWKMQTGIDPYPMQIDHIDMDRLNNHLGNLRTVDNQTNNRNRRKNKNNKTGRTGVTCYRDGFIARICNNHIGVFDNFGDAVEARKSAEEKLSFIYHG